MRDADLADGRMYSSDHEWVLPTDAGFRIGISAYAVEALGDVVYVDLAVTMGDAIAAGAVFGHVESIKATSDLFAPIGGEVNAVNDELDLHPELVNEDPYGRGWLIEIRADANLDEVPLKNVEQYRAYLGTL